MPDFTRREAIKLATVVGLDALGHPPIARAASEPLAISERRRVPYEQAVLADRPVAYWRLGEASAPTAVDATRHGHDGQYHGHPTYGEAGAIDGDRNTAVGFHGHEYVEIPNNVHFSQPTSQAGLTVEVWMRPDALDFPGESANPYVIWLGKGVAGNDEWGFRFYSLHKDPQHQVLSDRPNRISAYIWNPAGGTGAGAYFQDKLVSGQWLHVVACYQPGDKTNPAAGVQIYRDGQFRLGPPSRGTLYSNPEFNIMPAHGSAPVRLGTRDLGSFFRGGIDEVAIYPYVLHADKIREHYKIARG